MEPAPGLDRDHQLTLKDIPSIVKWHNERYKWCGRCTTVCPYSIWEIVTA